MIEKLYDVGKIVNTHGIRGELKIISVTDFPEKRYKKGSKLYLSHPSLKEPITVTIESAREHKNTYIVSFEEFSSINDVEKYKGGKLQIREEDRVELEEDEFYYQDIIGCEVWSDQGEKLGVIKEILTTGANDVWVVDGEKEILLPYIDDCILAVDLDQKRITAHIMEGLIP
ncbi:ribosome maturation factor RimM [Ammoniphilus resinae]|uniref:Ribosome maturation factor RimM n=1 Tax=Ammoniphilus resinae TaxID=861532 RepID=A0ABS4GKI1_9BACL|nr:ribosome maturation factor RimM [Ammoniphilus resinae]MBP1930763.1 16S rRNA processing protein RimM [Ammoniphilus resinae]